MTPIRDREAFFKYLQKGLQKYFDTCDKGWCGILHLTVGVKYGKVGGIIKSEKMMFYEGYTWHRVEEILRYVLPRFVRRDEVAEIIGEVKSHLREPNVNDNVDDNANADIETEPLPKPRRRGRRRKTETEVSTTNIDNHEQEE